MTRAITIFSLSVLAAPIMGILAAWDVSNEGVRFLRAASADAARELCSSVSADTPAAIHYACGFVFSARTIEWGLAITVAMVALFTVIYVLTIRRLAASRDLLSRYSPTLFRTGLALIVLILTAQGGSLLWVLWERLLAHHYNGWPWLTLMGAGLIAAAGLIVTSWRQLFITMPLDVDGVLADRSNCPELWARVDNLGRRLAASPPRQIVVGLQPTAFVTSAAIYLRGTGPLPAIETLYLPLAGLRLWTDAELDAVIGHELGHFRGQDLHYSHRLAPVLRSLSVSLETVRLGVGYEGTWGVSWFRAARLPASLALSLMLGSFRSLIATMQRERELVADQAGASVSSGSALIAAAGKLAVVAAEWSGFWSAAAHFVTMGRARANLCQDLLYRATAFSNSVPPKAFTEWLLASRQPHPFDSHPILAARAAALAVDPMPLLERALAAVAEATEPEPAIKALEERATRSAIESIRIPGGKLRLDETRGLPKELAGPWNVTEKPERQLAFTIDRS